jgi:hypothetical protein
LTGFDLSFALILAIAMKNGHDNVSNFLLKKIKEKEISIDYYQVLLHIGINSKCSIENIYKLIEGNTIMFSGN